MKERSLCALVDFVKEWVWVFSCSLQSAFHSKNTLLRLLLFFSRFLFRFVILENENLLLLHP